MSSAAASSSSNPAALGALAEAAGVAAVEQHSSSSSASGETAIKVIIHKALLCRVIEYREQPAHWRLPNIVTPAVFRAVAASDAGESTLYLYSVDERRWIIEVFPLPGCKQRLSQHDHPFCSLFVATPPATPMEAAAASVATSAPRPVDRGVNATLLDTIAATAAAAAAVRSFVRGPALFQPFDLLYNVSSRPFQLVVASRGSFIGANTGLYGCDECVHLREGERLWYIAQADKLDEFRKLFDNNNKLVPESSTFKQGAKKAVAVTKASKGHTATLLAHGVHAVHQKAGDTIYVPGGWVRAVKNLTDIVSFGSYYLRAWNLEYTIAFAEEEIKHGRLTANSGCVLDLPAIFHTLQQRSDDLDFGISSVAAKTTIDAWHASSAYALLGSSSDTPAAVGRNSKRQRSNTDLQT